MPLASASLSIFPCIFFPCVHGDLRNLTLLIGDYRIGESTTLHGMNDVTSTMCKESCDIGEYTENSAAFRRCKDQKDGVSLRTRCRTDQEALYIRHYSIGPTRNRLGHHFASLGSCWIVPCLPSCLREHQIRILLMVSPGQLHINFQTTITRSLTIHTIYWVTVVSFKRKLSFNDTSGKL
jgi:hypothetical protein